MPRPPPPRLDWRNDPYRDAPPWAVDLAWRIYDVYELLAPKRIVVDVGAAEVGTQPAPQGGPMAQPPFTINLTATQTYAIPLQLVTDPGGTTVPVPSGDTFSVANTGTGAAAIDAAIGLMPDGVTPALLINAITLPSANTAAIPLTVTDSNGDVAATGTVAYPVPVVDDIVVDVAGATIGTQAAPTATGP